MNTEQTLTVKLTWDTDPAPEGVKAVRLTGQVGNKSYSICRHYNRDQLEQCPDIRASALGDLRSYLMVTILNKELPIPKSI